jgi:sulfur carrier protein
MEASMSSRSMEIQVNGETRQVPEGASISVLLDDLSLTGRRIAVEVNQDIVPRSRHDEHRLNDGDRVEIIHAIGGG